MPNSHNFKIGDRVKYNGVVCTIVEFPTRYPHCITIQYDDLFLGWRHPIHGKHCWNALAVEIQPCVKSQVGNKDVHI